MNSANAGPAAPHDGGTVQAGPRAWAGLGVLTLPVLLISVDMTVLGFAVPYLSEDLSPSSDQLLWIVDIYSFVLAGLLVTMGAIGDRIGRRRLLLLGSAGFGLASLAAAYAPTPEALIAARALLGLAGATLMPSTLSLLRNMFLDARQRLLAIAVWASGFSAGSAVGPILGGWLLEHFHWGAVFLINLPVMALILGATPLLVPESGGRARDGRAGTVARGGSSGQPAGRVDLPSVALSMGAMLPTVYGVKKLAESGPATLPVLAIVVGLVLGGVFLRRQLRLADPMIDVRLFTVREFGVGVGTNLLIVFALVASLFFLTQYLQLVQGISPLRAGVALLPGLVLSVVASFVAVRLSRRLSLGTVIVIGLALIGGGFAALVWAPLQNGAPLVAVAFGLIGTGMGLAETLTNNAIMSAAPPARAGAASAISETAYELGGALGVALLGSVLTAVYRLHLDTVPGVPARSMDAARETLGGATHAAQGLPPGTAEELMRAARAAFTSGMQVTSAIATVILAFAAIQAGVLLRRGMAVAPSAATAPPTRRDRWSLARTPPGRTQG